MLLACILSSFIVILIPQHNVIKYPEYWYELVFISLVGYWCFLIINMTLVCAKVLHYPEFKSPKVMLDLFWTTCTAHISIYYCIYVIWAQYFEYNHPMPFSGYITSYLVHSIIIIRLWYKFPNLVRINPLFRRRLKAYICYCVWILGIDFQFAVIAKLFTMVWVDMQWLFAIVLPMVKEFNDWAITQMMSRAVHSNIMGAKSVVKIYLSYNYSLFFILVLGTSATKTTSYCILGMNLGYNLYLCFKFIFLETKIIPKNEKCTGMVTIQNLKKEILTELILNETIDIVVPLAYITTFTVAYFGPNSEVLGNIGNDYWSYQKVDFDKIGTLFIFAMKMVLIDLVSAVISAILLLKCVNINAIQEYCKIMKKYWPILALTAVLNMNKVSQYF